ncbi:MAG: FIST C-terminal domain-containing protein [Clostridiales Family XIII bacterium]|nr:FIST C-terminal domain-containing protein [Clostridiales Family XIII bacterium]
MHNVSGDFFVRALTDILDGAPIFGMMSSDHTPDYHAAAVIYQGETYKDRVAFVLVHGAVTPKFYIAHIAKEKLFREKAVITSSASNQLYTVNDMPAADFLKHIGLQEDASGNLIGINTYPFILDFGDGTAPIVRVMFGVTEDGAAICGGDVPVGAMLTVGAIDDESILAVSRAKLKEIAADGPKDVTLIFSCVGRYFSLGYESDREILLVKEALRPIGGNYMFAYAGGEICPVSSSAGSEAGTANNRFHNDTFIACTF